MAKSDLLDYLHTQMTMREWRTIGQPCRRGPTNMMIKLRKMNIFTKENNIKNVIYSVKPWNLCLVAKKMKETASAILHNGWFYLRCFSFIFSRTKHVDENGEEQNLDSRKRALSTVIVENFIKIQSVKIVHFLWDYSPPNRDLLLLVHPPKETTMGFSSLLVELCHVLSFSHFFYGMDAAYDRWVTIGYQWTDYWDAWGLGMAFQ